MTDELLLLAKSGNRQALQQVLQSFEGWIIRQCNYYHLQGYDFEDLKQVCYSALLSALPKLKEEELITAPSYLLKTMENALRNECRKVLRYPIPDSLNKSTPEGLELIHTLKDEETSTESMALSHLHRERLKESYQLLSRQEKDLISYYIMNPYGGLKEYAEKYNCNYRHIRYIKDLALAKMRAHIQQG